MNDTPDPTVPTSMDAALRRRRTVIATVVLGALCALLAVQMLAEWRVALGAGLGGALLAAAAWGPLALRPAGISLGGAAASGALAVVGAYVGAGLVGGPGSPAVVDTEAAIALLFSFWIVIPIVVGAAVGLAVIMRARAGDRA